MQLPDQGRAGAGALVVLRSSSCVFVAVCLSPVLTARGDDKAPRLRGGSFETNMGEKGLKRFGLSYILKDTEERDRQLGEFNTFLAKLDEEFRPLFAEKERLKKRVSSAESDE